MSEREPLADLEAAVSEFREAIALCLEEADAMSPADLAEVTRLASKATVTGNEIKLKASFKLAEILMRRL